MPSPTSCSTSTGSRLGMLAAVAAGLWLALCIPTARAQEPSDDENVCKPCAGVMVDDPAVLSRLLPPQDDSGSIFVGWSLDLARDATTFPAALPAHLTPYVTATFRIAPPLLEREEEFATQLERLARAVRATARTGGEAAWVELRWQGEADRAATAEEFAYFLKRAAVAVTGAASGARVVVGPLGTGDLDFLRNLYSAETEAYIDAVSSSESSAEAVETFAAVVNDLDPGVAVVVGPLTLGDDRQQASSDLAALDFEDGELPGTGASAVASQAFRALARTAEMASAGASLTLFRFDDRLELNAANLAPFRLLAREFRGDISPDPYSQPTGASAWSFVRGEDLGLRVVVEAPADADRVTIELPDPQLRSPKLLDPLSGETQELYSGQRTGTGYRVTLDEPPRSFVLSFDRMSAAEAAALQGVEGVDDRVEVESTRQIPVEEILRRLQAFEDAQVRLLGTYIANNAMSLRFQLGGTQSLDATFSGAFFFRQGKDFDWAWQELFINGVKWRHKTLPEIPLIQPEKATAMPVEINFDKQYRYRLKGSGTAQGRACWVVEFEPAVEITPGSSLWQGTLWVDKELFGRVKTRAIQLGLEGEVVSNEETRFYTPLDRDGQPTEWSNDATYLATRLVGQQIFSVINSAVVVERELLLTNIEFDPTDFDARREAVLASPATMVRDTEKGMRYLVTDDETGERVVQENLDPSRRFLVGGAFYDESFDYPLPLAGFNWLNFDWRGTGTQTNVFIAGPLITADIATPSLFGSKWEAGIDAFALAFAGTDSIYRGTREATEEDVKTLRPNIDFTLGRPLGAFNKVQFEYSLGWNRFDDDDGTSPDFVLPEDHLDHRLGLRWQFNRSGWKARAGGSFNIRGDWSFWGLPDNTEFSPDQEEYITYGAAIGKTWHLPKFMKFGAEIEYVGGEDLDRFSQYQFGQFSDIRVHGFRSDLIRAEEAWGAHLSYGLNLGEVFRIDLLGDAALASNEQTGLDEEFLAGVGVAGTFIGPWRTIVNLDVGKAVSGPDDGYSAFIAFLKLFR